MEQSEKLLWVPLACNSYLGVKRRNVGYCISIVARGLPRNIIMEFPTIRLFADNKIKVDTQKEVK